MQFELRSFRTKVARRIFLLLVTCAIVPILGLAWISFSQVSKQIHEQSKNRLSQDTKAVRMSVVERLALLRAEIRVMASSLSAGKKGPFNKPSKALAEKIQERFTQLALLTEKGEQVSVLGTGDIPGSLSPAEMEHLLVGETLLRHRVKPNSPPAIYMYALFDPETPARGVVMAEVNRSYLWQVAEGRPAGTDLYLFDRSKNILFSSLPIESGREDRFLASLRFGHSGVLEWHDHTGAYVAAYSAIFLEPSFLSPEWIALLRQPRDEALAPMVEFTKAFPLIIVISLCVVLLLSFSQIQRTTRPIEILRDATQKIAQGAWGTKIEIKSGDEFESLGKSFNEMSDKLKEGRTLLVQAAKLSTMGQMAAGVIHEIKQPLTAIDGLLQLVMMNEHPPQQRKNLETASGAVKRLNAILERFRSFSRVSQEKMEPLSLAQVIGQVQALMEHQFGMKNIRCTVDAEENLPPVLGDEQGLHQVFSNLVINAVQAMEDKSEGQRDLDIRLHSSGVNVLAEVRDTGCGMSADVMERIFDPFFTTKDQDKGTGLGMAIVESILHQHGARIEVDSEVGAGTTFTLTFTAAPGENSVSGVRG